VYVLELSSFMLDDMHHFRAHIAILLNITPDHLDRYNYDMDAYVDSKFRIIQNQQAADYFIYCADDEEIAKGLKRHKTLAMPLPFTQQQHSTLEQGAFIDEQRNLIINIPKREPFTPG
ncbi:Mur ligase family protein, partial [Brucella sp. 21LCYQ03]|nr:Mur ligase family protein [Brucella sp. 21LCYQ03]